MAGHSKWKNIRIKKGRVDAQKGKLFTKLSRDILIACKQGGADPDANFRLKDAITRAREASMPRDNIERLLDKAKGGGEGMDLDEVTYEGYGPAGVAIMVEAATNNRNRTAAEVRLIFSKNGGSVGESGCVGWLFDRKGLVHGSMKGVDEEHLMLVAIEGGAEDVSTEDGAFTLTCEVADLQGLRGQLEAARIAVTNCELTMIAKTTVDVPDEAVAQLMRLVDLLEEHDDVQQVHANFELSEAALEALQA